MIIKEFCAENFTLIPKAIRGGARRIELCDNLACGGTTVSSGVLEETLAYCGEFHVPVMTMIRPRGGNFVYNDTELKIMHTDLIEAKKLGTDGVVFGCLTEDNQLDKEALLPLIEAAEGLQITFHMAFDQIEPAQQFAALDWLKAQGVSRILTHGGAAKESIESHAPHLLALIEHANKDLTILPGGGITSANAEEISALLGVNEVHGTAIVPLD